MLDRSGCIIASSSMPTTDPWSRTSELLSKSPPRLQFGDRWRPGETQNPRHSKAPYFSPGEAVEFVKKSIRELVKHRARFGSGCPPRVHARDETYFKDPGKRAFVLVISGDTATPPVYVKWVFTPSDAARDMIHFVSFHQSVQEPES
jgi:hypothetical protein